MGSTWFGRGSHGIALVAYALALVAHALVVASLGSHGIALAAYALALGRAYRELRFSTLRVKTNEKQGSYGQNRENRFNA